MRSAGFKGLTKRGLRGSASIVRNFPHRLVPSPLPPGEGQGEGSRRHPSLYLLSRSPLTPALSRGERENALRDDRLLRVLPGVPILTVDSAARLIDRSVMRTGEAVNRLADAGILRQRDTTRQRYRVFEADDVVGLFVGLDRALASPTGDTATDPPVRAAARRPSRKR